MLKFIQVFLLSLATTITAQFAYAASVGDEAPSFRARSLNGSETISNTDLQGKVIFVDFWASWCPPCRVENRHYQSLVAKLPEDQFAIFAVIEKNWRNY